MLQTTKNYGSDGIFIGTIGTIGTIEFYSTIEGYKQMVGTQSLISTGRVFEINTGAISRGWRTDAYPATEIRQYIRDHGGKMILSSDAHQKENICFQFEKYMGELDR